jgi:hypothetical protein
MHQGGMIGLSKNRGKEVLLEASNKQELWVSFGFLPKGPSRLYLKK